MDAGHLLTEEDFNRTGRVVARGERELFGITPDAFNREGAPTHQILKIQAGASNAFGYPARIQKWNESAGDWGDLDTTEVRVEDPNGSRLGEGMILPVCRLVGTNAAGVACFSAEYTRVEAIEPFNSGVTPPHAILNDGKVKYANLSTMVLDDGELCWWWDINA